jgi:hypothetical protein
MRMTVRTAGYLCVAAAILGGIGAGLWELLHPILQTDVALATADVQRWGNSALQVFKTIGFVAGLWGFATVATRRGRITRTVLTLAALGGAFYAAVFLWIAVSRHLTLLYVLGGLWYQWVAPVTIGIAALRARRVPNAVSIWVIIVGVLNAVIFGPLGPAVAQIVQGVIWLPIGLVPVRYATSTARPTRSPTAVSVAAR